MSDSIRYAGAIQTREKYLGSNILKQSGNLSPSSSNNIDNQGSESTVASENMSPAGVKVAELGAALRAEILGDGSTTISSIQSITEAGPNDLSFLDPRIAAQNPDLKKQAAESKAGALVVASPIDGYAGSQIVFGNPYAAIITIATRFFTAAKPEAGIHPTAIIAEDAVVGANVHIGAYAVIGSKCRIGDNCVLHPHVVLYENVELGSDCLLHAHTVIRENITLGDDCLTQPGVRIGSDGFGYIPDKEIGHRRIPHIGSVRLGDRVDMGANACIDRATFGTTSVGPSTKIDNLVQIGHNCVIGDRSLICGMVGIGGSTNIGDDVVLGGHTGVANNVTITSKVRAGGKTGVNADVTEPGDYLGFPVTPASDFRRQAVGLKNTPKLMQRVRKLEQRLAALEEEQLGRSSKAVNES